MRKPRYIYCLEGNWNTNPRSKQSIRPILDILYYSAGIRYVYRKCNTKDEFFEYLQIGRASCRERVCLYV